MKTLKLRLVLDLEIYPHGESTDFLKGCLHRIVKDAASNGTFTGESAATVEKYDYKVTDFKPKKKLPRRKTGEHLWHESNGVTKCVTCFCDEDSAYVGGQDCTFIAGRGNIEK